MKRLLYIITFVGFVHSMAAAASSGQTDQPSTDNRLYFGFSTELKKAYDLILSLRLEEGRYLLKKIKRNDPNNTLVYLIEDYIDFFTLFIGERKIDFDRLVHNKKKRIAKIKSADKDSPFYLYAQAEINLHWALIRTKFEQRFKAFNEMNYAYDLLVKNQYKFPRFYANKKSLGVLHATLGTIPDKYKWGIKLLTGMEGTIQQGLLELEDVINHSRNEQFFFADEALILYTFIQLHLNNSPSKAFQLVQEANLNTKDNPLACFVLANIALRTGHNDLAIKVLEQKPTGPQYLDFWYLDFSLGIAKLHQLDKGADTYLLKFVNSFSGRNYIKEAYQKLAWHAVIFKDESKYKYYMQQALDNGYAIVDEDKNAKTEALKAIVPHKGLLKIRMLTDGGYYDRALKELKQLDLGFEEDQYIEYIYRKARLYQQLDKPRQALDLFKQILDTWPTHTSYMICNAALQSGLIYEKNNLNKLALSFYNLCLEKKPSEYKTGLHQKAKAGIIRLKK